MKDTSEVSGTMDYGMKLPLSNGAKIFLGLALRISLSQSEKDFDAVSNARLPALRLAISAKLGARAMGDP